MVHNRPRSVRRTPQTLSPKIDKFQRSHNICAIKIKGQTLLQRFLSRVQVMISNMAIRLLQQIGAGVAISLILEHTARSKSIILAQLLSSTRDALHCRASAV